MSDSNRAANMRDRRGDGDDDGGQPRYPAGSRGRAYSLGLSGLRTRKRGIRENAARDRHLLLRRRRLRLHFRLGAGRAAGFWRKFFQAVQEALRRILYSPAAVRLISADGQRYGFRQRDRIGEGGDA